MCKNKNLEIIQSRLLYVCTYLTKILTISSLDLKIYCTNHKTSNIESNGSALLETIVRISNMNLCWLKPDMATCGK